MAVVTLFSKPSCVQCNASKRDMDKKSVSYKTVDMSQDAAALEEARSLGYMQAPVTTVELDGQVIDHWSGYRPDKIAILGQASKDSTFDLVAELTAQK